MDYYQILDISYDSDADTIKKKFRTLSKSYHPDKGGDENKYKQITEAYTVLGDSVSKKKYDNLLFSKKNNIEEEDKQETRNDPFENVVNQFMKSNRNYMDFDDIEEHTTYKNLKEENIKIIIKDLYNKGCLTVDILDTFDNNLPFDISKIINLWKKIIEREEIGKNIKKVYKVSVNISDLIDKKKRKVIINNVKKCIQCNGLNLYKCRACYTIYNKKYVRCLECRNQLKQIYCNDCKSKGYTNNYINLTIPLYKREFTTKNNLTIKIITKNEENFTIVNEHDLKTNYEINLYDCICGTTIKIKYFNSKQLSIKIPAKVQLNVPFVVKNYGLLNKEGTKRGNLLIDLIVKYPKKTSRHLKQILS